MRQSWEERTGSVESSVGGMVKRIRAEGLKEVEAVREGWGV